MNKKHKIIPFLFSSLLFIGCLNSKDKCINKIKTNEHEIIKDINSLEQFTNQNNKVINDYYFETKSEVRINNEFIKTQELEKYLSQFYVGQKKANEIYKNIIELRQYDINGMCFNEELNSYIYRIIDLGTSSSYDKFIYVLKNEDDLSKINLNVNYDYKKITDKIYLLERP